MTDQTTDKKSTRPIFRKKLPNGISAAVFENERDGRVFRSINLQRSYKGKDGNWARSSIYIDHEHIPFAIEALQGVWRFLNDYRPEAISTPQGEAYQSAELEHGDA